VLTLPLGDNAELRALEPWLAAEFAAFIEAARPHLAPWLPWATSITDEAGAREFLQRYAEQQAGGEGRIYGSGSMTAWSAARCSGRSMRPAGCASSASGWRPRRKAKGWSPGPPGR